MAIRHEFHLRNPRPATIAEPGRHGTAVQGQTACVFHAKPAGIYDHK